MPFDQPVAPDDRASIALVDGDPALRRARQLMLRAEHYEVRAYSTCAALLADPLALRSACVIADVEMRDFSGLQLLRAMRSAGWAGSAILLADVIPDMPEAVTNDPDVVARVPKALANAPLLKAVRLAIAQRSRV